MMLDANMVLIEDHEGNCIPSSFSKVIDTHVHIFPSPIFKAVWKWFDEHGWPIRYRFGSTDILRFLLSKGVDHIIALQYAHKPGIAIELNQYMATQCTLFPGQVTGMATVFPGEQYCAEILNRAFDLGLAGVKLHAHVQCFDLESTVMDEIYDCCQKKNKPLIIHAGREPGSQAYKCDPFALCNVKKIRHILNNFQGIKLCVPHLGFDELSEYRDLIERYDNLWLDTTMTLADYLPVNEEILLGNYRHDRIMYGSDFPNIPYAWDRELKKIEKRDLNTDLLDRFLHKNARDFFGLTQDFPQKRES